MKVFKASEEELDQASRLLRGHGYLVLRPDPFRDDDLRRHLKKKGRAKVRSSQPRHGSRTRERVALIRQHAGKMPGKKIAELLGISKSNLSFIASTHKISLRIRK